MRLSALSKIALTLVVMMSTSASAGPMTVEYGTCQTGGLLGRLVLLIVVCWLYITIACNKLAVACYRNEGYTFGTVKASDATPAVLACNGDLGTCSAKCAATHLQCESDAGTTAQCAKWLSCAYIWVFFLVLFIYDLEQKCICEIHVNHCLSGPINV